jgi:hypothetical protein
LTRPPTPRFHEPMQRRRVPTGPTPQFQAFQASELFCNRCRVSQPVRERLLLVLPEGELHEYLCGACGASLGTRKITAPPPQVFLG